jgi:molecular chaperone DnaK
MFTWILIRTGFPAMADFKDQIDKTEADNVTKLIADLRAIAAKGQAGEADVTADAIRDQISKTQQASLGLFSKVR